MPHVIDATGQLNGGGSLVSSNTLSLIRAGISQTQTLLQRASPTYTTDIQDIYRRIDNIIGIWKLGKPISSSFLVGDNAPYKTNGDVSVVITNQYRGKPFVGSGFDEDYNRVIINPVFAENVAAGKIGFLVGKTFQALTFGDIVSHELGHRSDSVNSFSVLPSYHPNGLIDLDSENLEMINEIVSNQSGLFRADHEDLYALVNGKPVLISAANQSKFLGGLPGIFGGDSFRGVVEGPGGKLYAVIDNQGSTIEISSLDGQVGRAAGSALGEYLTAGDGLLAHLAADTVLSSIGQAFGNTLSTASKGVDLSRAFDTAFSHFDQTLFNNLKAAGAGALSAFTSLELGNALGLHGFGAELFGTISGAATSPVYNAVIGNILAGQAPFKNFSLSSVFGGGGVSLGSIYGPSIGSFFGAKLGSLVISPTTQAGAVLSSIGSTVGVIVATHVISSSIAFVTNFAIPGIGAFVGFVLGALIGDLFGHHKPRIPGATAETVIQIPYALYGIGAESASNGGDLAFADQMAKIARDTLNGIIEQVTGRPVGAAFVANGYSPTQAYGYSGNQIYVKLNGAQNNVTTADQAIDKGVLWALPQTKIIGGDLILKRAISSSPADSVAALLGDLQVASDYENYLRNIGTINSLIAQDPTSSFSAAWIVTLGRANELGLNGFKVSDFYGGLQGFLQSFGIAATGSTVHYEDVSAQMVNNDLKISATGASAAGTFSLLPQANADGSAITIGNFASTVGYAIGGPTGGNDLISATTVIPIANASFENPAHDPGVNTGGIPSWVTAGDTGTWYPTGLITATDGNQVAYLDPQWGWNAIAQQVGTWIAGQTYTFAVDLGVRSDVATYGAVYLHVSDGVTDLATSISPAFYPWGSMHTATVSYTATAADAGKPLVVSLVASGSNQIDIDNLRLSSTTSTLIPLSNPSFENPGNADGVATGSIPGWGMSGDNGTWNATSQIAVTDGDNNAYLNPQSGYSKIYQQAGTYVAGQTYTFSIDAGVRNDIGANADVSLFISNNTAVLATTDTVLTAPHGTMQRISVSYTASAADAGNPLYVTVEPHSASQVNVDNARLIATSGFNVGPGDPGYDYGEYGYAPATNTGDDIILGGAGADNLNAGSGNVWINGGDGNDTLTGGAGRDVLLGGGGIDYLYAGSGDTYLSGGDGSDALIGGNGNDTFVGGYGNDTELGGGGNDTFIIDPDGGAEWDYIDGGAGSDTVSFERLSSGVVADMWTGQGNGYTSLLYGDGLVSIENETGTQFNDLIFGNDGGNVLKGLGGDDWLAGRPGDDILEGGAGADYMNGDAGTNALSYADSSARVYVNLWTHETFGGDATGDTFDNIQNIIGSSFDDELEGQIATTSIQAGAGDDWIDGTRSNPGLVIDGGDGFDTMDYSQDNFQVGSGTATGYDPDYGYYSYTATIPALSVTMTTSGATVDYRDGDGYQATQNLVSIEQVIGTQTDDVFQSYGNVNVTWNGGGGNDIYYGGSGSDTYVFGRGYGVDLVYDSNTSSNVISLDGSLTFDDLWVGNYNNGNLQFGVRGTGDYIQVAGQWATPGNDVIKTLDLGGVAQIDLTQLRAVMIGDDNNNYVSGPANTSNILFGYNGDDTLSPANGSYSTNGSIVDGGLGNDTINTSVGDDQFLFERGDGHDVINDGGGQNTIIFGSTVAADDVIYKVSGNDLYIGIKDLSNDTLDATQVADNIRIVGGGVQYIDQNFGTVSYNTVFSVEAGGATTALAHANIAWTQQSYWSGGYYYPIVLDLNGDGLEITPVAQSDIVTKDASGNVLRTSWVGPTNGILAVDRDGDGKINSTSEISFVQDKAGATTDLEGLAGWDTNGDGALDDKDTNWGKLVVWTDGNQDGRSGVNEVQTLAQLGIASISLKPLGTGFDSSDTIDTVVRNTTSFTRTDGTVGIGYDVGFARQLLTGPVATNADVATLDVTAAAEFGRLDNDPVALATSQILSGGKLVGRALSVTNVSALAAVDVSDTDKQISAVDAARWADFIDPEKIAARKTVEATGFSGSEYLDKIRTTIAYPDGGGALTGRATHDAQTRLQAVIVDFSGDGPSLIDPIASHALVDTARDGTVAEIGWVAPADGMLAFDRNGDGRVDPSTELSFLGDTPNARTAIAGLASFDTSGDGVLSNADSAFARFLIWRDANGNGVSDLGETQSLDQAGVVSINLVGGKVNPDRGAAGSNDVLGVTSIVFSDDSKRAAYDVALGYADATSTEQPTLNPVASPNPLPISSTPIADTGAVSSTGDPANTSQPTVALSSDDGSVGSSRGALDGPAETTIAPTSVDSTDPQWWRNASLVGSTLAGLSLPSTSENSSLGANLGSPVAIPGGIDAAALQRQALLRQAMATLQGASGGSAAIWMRDVANDTSPSLSANDSRAVARPTSLVAVGG